MREGSPLRSHSRKVVVAAEHWVVSPPTPKQFDGHDVSLRFSNVHGFAYPVAAVAAMLTTIVMGQGWTGENFSWGARVHDPEVGG